MYNKKILEILMHTNKPDLMVQYDIEKCFLIAANSVPGWTNTLELPPTSEWYDNIASFIPSTQKMVVMNWENLPTATQQNRLDGAAKMATLISELKIRRPTVLFSMYWYPTTRDYWNATKAKTHADFIAWQGRNTDYAALAQVIDFFCPSVYFFYTRASFGVQANDGVSLYVTRNIEETKRLRDTYNPTKKIYPFTYNRATNGSLLDFEAYQMLLQTTLSLSDGMVMWGGWQESWDETAPWWLAAKHIIFSYRNAQL